MVPFQQKPLRLPFRGKNLPCHRADRDPVMAITGGHQSMWQLTMAEKKCGVALVR